MSHNFDALEITIRELTEIVERSHHRETASLVKQINDLIDEMRTKSRSEEVFPRED